MNMPARMVAPLVLAMSAWLPLKAIGQTESPEHFMKGVLMMANERGHGRGVEVLDGSRRIYSPSFLDAIYGEGCFTAHRLCVTDHLMRLPGKPQVLEAFSHLREHPTCGRIRILESRTRTRRSSRLAPDHDLSRLAH